MDPEVDPRREMSDMPTATTTEDRNALFVRLLEHHIRFTVAKRRVQMSKHDWYRVTALAVRDMLVERMLETRARFERSGSKKLFYLSLEYLIGRSLENNLFNLGIIEGCREFLGENGIDLNLLFDDEPDAGLGNGGLGRLAHAFSIRSRRWTCPATPTASTTSSGCFARKCARVFSTSGRTVGGGRCRPG